MAATESNATQWLNSHTRKDRMLLARIFDFCSTLFIARGTEKTCIVDCQPAGIYNDYDYDYLWWKIQIIFSIEI